MADPAQGLAIPRALVEAMAAHCDARYPKEACGYLARARGGARTIVQGYPMRNVEDSPIGYAMDPKEQLQTEQLMRQRQQELAAIYHSHTTSDAYPSSVDVSLAISPDVSYVLVSLKDRRHPVARSFRIDGARVTEEPLVVTG